MMLIAGSILNSGSTFMPVELSRLRRPVAWVVAAQVRYAEVRAQCDLRWSTLQDVTTSALRKPIEEQAFR